jgi:hypothetical protein
LWEKGARFEDTKKASLVKAAWIEFFKEAQIQKELVKDYAKIFRKERMRFEHLGTLDRALLNMIVKRYDLGTVGRENCTKILETAQKVKFSLKIKTFLN